MRPAKIKEHPITGERYRILPVRENYIPIIIDPSLLNLNDAKMVKDHVWAMVESEILKRKEEIQEKTTGWHPDAPPDEPEEIAFIYRTKEETFYKYLRWYDLHINEKLGFRLIAFIENQTKGNPVKIENILEKLLLRSRLPKLGDTNGEDAVGKGIKLIYKAIHRKPYNQQDVEPIIEEYNCPQHDKSCSPNCRYLIEWQARFDRLNNIF